MNKISVKKILIECNDDILEVDLDGKLKYCIKTNYFSYHNVAIWGADAESNMLYISGINEKGDWLNAEEIVEIYEVN